LRDRGIELDSDTADARLSYLVEHGNTASANTFRSGRATSSPRSASWYTDRSRSC
jgi:hypothetical protein